MYESIKFPNEQLHLSLNDYTGQHNRSHWRERVRDDFNKQNMNHKHRCWRESFQYVYSKNFTYNSLDDTRRVLSCYTVNL